MRTITLKKLLDMARREAGIAKTAFRPEVAEDFCGWLEKRMRRAWTYFPFPELCPVEERVVGEEWDPLHAYTLGYVIVYRATTSAVWTYYEALSNFVPAGLEPGSVGAELSWGLYSVTRERRLDYVVNGYEAIGEVFGIYGDNPRISGKARPVPFELASDGVYLGGEVTGSSVWLKYRVRPPEYTTELYSGAVTYTKGDLVYLESTGHCYMALDTLFDDSPTVFPDYWLTQPVPEILADYAAAGAKADFLSDDGQDEKATAAEGAAQNRLDQQVADIVIHQGQRGTYEVLAAA